jgi:methyl-accepting chemotaxis protein
MKFRFTIGLKIGVGFGVLTLALILNAFLTFRILNHSHQLNELISKTYHPSEAQLKNLEEALGNSRMLIKNWVYIDKISDTPNKRALVELHEETLPAIQTEISKLIDHWTEENKDLYQSVYLAMRDTLFEKHRYVMSQLDDIAKYDDPFIIFEIFPMVEEDGEIMVYTAGLEKKVKKLITNQEQLILKARSEVDRSFVRFQRFILGMCIILVLTAIAIAYLTISSLVRPINHIKNILLQMAKGMLPRKKIRERHDEIGQMAIALNNLVSGLGRISDFSIEIGKGNYQSEFTPLSEEDILGNALLRMREDLKNASVEEVKRKKEDSQRNWATQGVALFSDILRKDNDKVDILSYNIISQLVKYMNANQGGLFLVNDSNPDDIHIEMVACYAYDRQKFVQKRIERGEGLIGRCIQEKETIFLSEIPQGYSKISSGMGEEDPRCLLIVPLTLNDEVFGVIEIASFDLIEPYQVEFVEKIGESIAATISTVRINIRTAILLTQSQQQAEEMAAQEEEMRQNMEELRATQEQSARREAELKKALEELQGRMS